MDLSKIDNPKWALESLVDIQVNISTGAFPLKAGTLFIYNPNKLQYIHIISREDIPDNVFTEASTEILERRLEGLIGSEAKLQYILRFQEDTNQKEWLEKNFKLVPCPEELQIEAPELPVPRYIIHPDAFNKFKDANDWPKEGGDISKKMFKFGEKALFIEDWPPGIKSVSSYADKRRFFIGGEEYPTLGSSEIKVLVINKKGELDFIPFFAVQNTGRIARWFAFRWWWKIHLVQWGLTKSHGRFASDRVPYEDDRDKKPAQIRQLYYIGERLLVTDDFPMAGWGATFKKGDIVPTLGVYRGKSKATPNYLYDFFKPTEGLAFTEPRALVTDKLGRLDLIPLSQVKSTGTYDIFFALKYYVIIGWYTLTNKLKSKKK